MDRIMDRNNALQEANEALQEANEALQEAYDALEENNDALQEAYDALEEAYNALLEDNDAMRFELALLRHHNENRIPRVISHSETSWLFHLCRFVVALFAMLGVMASIHMIMHGTDVFFITLTDLRKVAWLIIHFLSKLPYLFAYNVGPVNIFISPLSLCPFPLPDWVPFKRSYLAVTIMDHIVPCDVAFVNLHMYPSFFLYLPPLSSLSFSAVPPFTVNVICISASIKSVPLELVGFRLYASLSSLLWLRLCDVKIGVQLFPGIQKGLKLSTAEASVIADNTIPSEPFVGNTETYLSGLETDQIIDDLQGEISPLVTFEGAIVSSLLGWWLLASQHYF